MTGARRTSPRASRSERFPANAASADARSRDTLRSFPPAAAADAGLLILGSMPGAASLAAGQYYAHPHNGFWPIMADVLGFERTLPYEQRLAELRSANIALWDVLHSCEREGSLDASIRRDSRVANDFASFFAAHPRVRRVLFNGAAAEQCYRRLVLASGIGGDLEYERLPSTSPANASWSRARKLEAWRRAILGAVR